MLVEFNFELCRFFCSLPGMRKGEVCREFLGYDYILQQDGARCHTSKYSLQFLEQHASDYLAPDMWPPNSTDISPLDYGIWGHLKNCVW